MPRFISDTMGLRKTLRSERNSSGQIEHFRHEAQELGPVMEHVKHTAQKVNTAPKPGNKNGWHFIGSIPMVILLDWIKGNNITIDAFARNEDGCKDKFKKWFLNNRDLNKFNAETY